MPSARLETPSGEKILVAQLERLVALDADLRRDGHHHVGDVRLGVGDRVADDHRGQHRRQAAVARHLGVEAARLDAGAADAHVDRQHRAARVEVADDARLPVLHQRADLVQRRRHLEGLRQAGEERVDLRVDEGQVDLADAEQRVAEREHAAPVDVGDGAGRDGAHVTAHQLDADRRSRRDVARRRRTQLAPAARLQRHQPGRRAGLRPARRRCAA